jgi:hypothetical protein
MLKELWYLKKRHDYLLLGWGLWRVAGNFTSSVVLALAFTFLLRCDDTEDIFLGKDTRRMLRPQKLPNIL